MTKPKNKPTIQRVTTKDLQTQFGAQANRIAELEGRVDCQSRDIGGLVNRANGVNQILSCNADTHRAEISNLSSLVEDQRKTAQDSQSSLFSKVNAIDNRLEALSSAFLAKANDSAAGPQKDDWAGIVARLDACIDAQSRDISTLFERLNGVEAALAANAETNRGDIAKLLSRLDYLHSGQRAHAEMIAEVQRKADETQKDLDLARLGMAAVGPPKQGSPALGEDQDREYRVRYAIKLLEELL